MRVNNSQYLMIKEYQTPIQTLILEFNLTKLVPRTSNAYLTHVAMWDLFCRQLVNTKNIQFYYITKLKDRFSLA